MKRMQLMTLTEGLAAGDQCRVIFQASQLLTGSQQASPQMAFARTPIQPMVRHRSKRQPTGERFNLLPFAPWHIDIQAMPGRFKRLGREFAYCAQIKGQSCEGCKRLRRIQ
ncbi:hypothetical protein D3C86_1480480 [compost metagenome]